MVDIDSTILHNLAEVLLNEVPQAQSRDGRDVLLVGIPNWEGWDRVRENAHVDIMKIISYLVNIFRGEREEEQGWGLLIFIDNACRCVEGTTTQKKLQELRAKCVQHLKKGPTEQTPKTADRLSRKRRVHPVETAALAIKTFPTPALSSSPILPRSSEEESSFTSDPSLSNFFEQASAYVTAIRKAISKTSNLFQDPLIEEATPTECRDAIEQLSAATQQLEKLYELLDATSPLPKEITSDRHLLVEKIEYLTEQIERLVERIDEGNTKNKVIHDRFLTIEQELSEFAILTDANKVGGTGNV